MKKMFSVSPFLRVSPFPLPALFALLVITAACSRTSSTLAPAILLADAGGTYAYVDVAGLPGDVIDALDRATPEQWTAAFTIAVAPGAPAMLGEYSVVNDVARFKPAFPLDRGRQYHVTFDASKLPGIGVPPTVLTASVGRPASTAVPSTVVSHIYPTGDVVPENLLRMYIEFSAPMGNKSGVEYIKVLNESGTEIPGAVLPLDYQFWSPDHRRFTVFFDPGRVKDGILPNREMGRPLTYGGAMTLVISTEWKDANGLALKEEYRRTFKVAAADTRPLDPKSWTIQPPAAGGRTGMVITFPEPLDHGLLMRALGVRRNGQAVAGEITVDQNETRWTFVPEQAWQPGAHELLALDILEDLAGNQIGRAFEVDNFDTVDKSPNPQTITIPFTVR